MPPAIVARAREYISEDNKQFEDVIEQLERSRIAMERERETAQRLREEYEAFKKNAERKIERQLADADRTLDKAREKANAMVTSAKISSDYILEEADKVRRARDSERLGEQLAETRRNVRAYLREHAQLALRPRLDVIEVYVRRGTTGTEPSDILKIHHIRNAFSASSS
jgi:DNA mismatch repair protein MutS2